ncbi:MAG: cytochrome c biogenesis protein CcdA [Chloroflexi bacterium]|nr:cytochrome c biogenesis protein CcdA [Chloroflexota bacterium]
MSLAASRRLRPVARTTAYLAFGLGVAFLLIMLGNSVYRVQGGVAEVAPLFPFGYAYAAGMVAAVNPCGVLFLPSLVAFYLGGSALTARPWWQRTASAVGFGVLTTAGFVVLFATVGAIFAVGGRVLGAFFPVGGTLVGLFLAGLGAWAIVTDSSLGIVQASRAMAVMDVRQSPPVFLFGLAYGVASLACTLPVFLAVVGTSLTAGGVGPALGQFLSYALGMGTMVTIALVVAVFFEQTLARFLRRVVPHVHRVAASLLFAAGLFIINYWMPLNPLLA